MSSITTTDFEDLKKSSGIVSEERKKSSRRKADSENKLINFLISRPKWMWIMVTATLGRFVCYFGICIIIN
jgi:hypothetical protein